MKILVTGDRNWTNTLVTYQVISAIHAEYPDLIVVHGDQRGADRLAGQAAKACGATPIPMPADWVQHGNAAGPIRNQHMLNEHPDIETVLAFHTNLAQSKGTRDMVIRSLAHELPVFLLTGKEVWQLEKNLNLLNPQQRLIYEKKSLIQRSHVMLNLSERESWSKTLWNHRLPVKRTSKSAD